MSSSNTNNIAHVSHLQPAHTCWWEGQSQVPTIREALSDRKSGAAATGRKARVACPFAGNDISF